MRGMPMAVKGPSVTTDRVEANLDILLDAYKGLHQLDMRCIPKMMREDVSALRVQASKLTAQLEKYVETH